MSWLEHRFGGRRQLLTHIKSGLRLRAGGWRAERHIDWPRVTRLVFICSGNICRSPYAAARARLMGLETASCGLHTDGGALADPTASRVALQRRLDLGQHRSQAYGSFEFRDGDLLVMFEPGHITSLNGRSACGQVTLAGLWARRPQPYIADPYGKSDRYFQHCFSLIDQSVDTLVERLAQARGGIALDRVGRDGVPAGQGK